MKSKKLISILVIAIIAILMLTTAMATAQTVSATSKMKVTWDANGGKIGNEKIVTSKHTKNAKVGKLPKTPKRTGYAFKGWYTKKSGGTKVSKASKVKKSLTHYAQWKRSLSSSESSLIGTWSSISSTTAHSYTFKNDGTFIEVGILETSMSKFEFIITGVWGVSGNTIVMGGRTYQSRTDGGSWSAMKPHSTPTGTMKYKFGANERGKYLEDLKYDGVLFYYSKN